MEFALRAAEHEFRRILHERGRDAPALRNIHVHRCTYNFEVEFRAEFSSDLIYAWRIDERNVPSWRDLIGPEFAHHCMSLYSRLFEDHLLELELQPRREALCQMAEAGLSYAHIAEAHEEYRRLEEHVRRHHREAPVVYVDCGRGLDASTVDLRPGAINYVADGFDLQHPDYLAYQQRQYPARQESEAKGLKLLKDWLSPDQAKQYEAHQYFDVTGSDTGKRYRIKHGRQMNIDELDKKGHKVVGWCFLPEGQLVAGDCMLAQKIALETNESAALNVANKFAVAPDYTPRED